MQFQQLLDQELPADELLSAPQLTQVQSIVQGSLNEAIEKATSAAAQATVCAFSGSPPPAPALAILAGESPVDVTPTSSTVSTTNSLPESQMLSTSPGSCSRSATDTAMDSVHELPAKLVKEILTGEFMELSKLLPKNFNVLNLSQDEPLTLTVEYMSLTRYAARHHNGLVWCVYNIKFQQKAATKKSLKWSTIDS